MASPEAPAEPSSPPPAAPAPRDARSLWQGVIEQAPTRQLRALLGQAELVSLAGGNAHIRAAAAVAPMIEARRAAIEPLLRQVAGRSFALEIQAQPAPGSGEAAGEQAGEAVDAGQQPAGAAASSTAPDEEHPLVRRAAELFNAKVVHVEPLRRPQ